MNHSDNKQPVLFKRPLVYSSVRILINILVYLISVRSFQAVNMIYQILLFFVVISLAAGSEINLRKLYEDAEGKIDSELRRQMMAGMKSSRMNRKKFTA